MQFIPETKYFYNLKLQFNFVTYNLQRFEIENILYITEIMWLVDIINTARVKL